MAARRRIAPATVEPEHLLAYGNVSWPGESENVVDPRGLSDANVPVSAWR